MRVIERGRDQTGWAAEYVCTGAGNGEGGCSAKLLVEQGDLFQTTSGHYDGSTDYYVTFRCPQCRVLTDVMDSPFNAPSLPRERREP